MTTARLVPVTTEMDGDELDAEDAWHITRRVGVARLVVDSFVRFRYGDGFTNSRAVALQTCLAVVPFFLALTGLVADIDQERPATVVATVVQSISPGAGRRDALADAVSGESSEAAGELALGVGLVVAVLAMTTAMGQVERGLNRIYGIRRDRPAVAKYGRAAALTVVLAAPLGVGFLLLVGGRAFGDAMAEGYGWSRGAVTLWNVARWPVGLALLVLAIAVLLDHAPRRRQPSLSWLALGAATGVTIAGTATALLAVYVHLNQSFGEVYGPLAGIVALLLWALLCAVALFYGAAVCAQLEAYRAGDPRPVDDDPGRPHAARVH